MSRDYPRERLIAAGWGKTGASKFPVDIEIIAGGNPGLMRDILDVFTREKVRVASSTSSELVTLIAPAVVFLPNNVP